MASTMIISLVTPMSRLGGAGWWRRPAATQGHRLHAKRQKFFV